MKGPAVLLAAIAALAAAMVILITVGPRRLDPDVIAGIAVGILIGGTLDALLPYLVRLANRVMRTRDRDGR